MLNEIDSFEEIKNIEIWLLKNELKIIKQNFSEEIKSNNQHIKYLNSF